MQALYFQCFMHRRNNSKELSLIISCLIVINHVIIIIEKGHPMICVELDLHVTWHRLTSS